MWDWNYAFEVLPDIASALWVTISATLVGFVLALVVGLIWTLLIRSNNKIISNVADGIVKFIRNTPLLVQLYFIFYVFPQFGLSLEPFTAGVIGLGLHYSTYLSEVYRSGIESVGPGQWEVATALNFDTRKTWTRIILPQAIPPVLPVIGNYFITMFKETPLLSAITLVEILQTAQNIGASTFRYTEPLTIVGVLFLLLSYPASVALRQLEIRVTERY
ncbi:ectoine/hydroxyectoine ABC transporter permease subunit EhuD [Alkalibacterium thalassium]|uniref:Amino acid ABC transporter membrane protein 2, PAAT family (TC 3.A.1.3.-) n=1 Tax=Alkalibacterium thalassium TaxID=426701 RepID=A0A1G9A160_9LACT|nr:ectoine/hydroxyectoine ABC transporter permease subunit EhuD [Alkalibacterium thalassium]SDK20604.1 amino acid ABC transporter membrane protein 2, PAAT family (TC 3.A.1.3.-) [Alkalibacterium thalassium]